MQETSTELGYLVRPGEAPAPGVVMIHDVWGLSDHTRDLARRLAGEGFAVLAIDLYRREAEVKIENPGVWMRALSDPQVLADLQAGVDFLSRGPSAGRGVGCVGFCMGGMYALMAACACRDLAASVPFYGLLSHRHGILHDPQGLDPARKPREPLDYAPELRCPLLAFFGERDDFVPLEDVRALEGLLADASAPSEVVVVPEVGHAFLNDTRPDAYRPKEAAAAWARMRDFLREK
ncbi:MAG: dienelactone hydrolase family protein, partial [Deltaproteobacteria bacterium]|nr:dienelactone hydrolase family protein [Deltaproteobacteria bacterium]